MDKTEILNRLDKVKFYQGLVPSIRVNGKPEALGLCPFHNDHNPSLSVNIETGLFRCFSCNTKGDIFAFYQKVKEVDFSTALRELGVMAGVVGSDTKPKIVATFKYTDEAGNVLYLKERLEPGRNGRSKEFVFKHLGGDRWVMGRGCDPVLYRLPEILKSENVFAVEGEAKADLLVSWGLTATCLDSGANSPLREEHLKCFEGKEKVVILPDNDKPGREYATKIANALYGKVKELKVVELPGLEEKEDVFDWAKMPGNDKSKLLEIVKDTPEWTQPKARKECDETAGFDLTKALRMGAELQVLDICIEYAVQGLIAKNAINLLSGYGGMGKTTLALHISDSITKEIPFLGLETMKMPVVYVDFENSLPTLVSRIRNLDATNVLFWHPSNEIKPPRLDTKEFELYGKLPQGSLIIFDTLRASHSLDENSSQDMQLIMGRLKKLRDLGFTILLLHHTSKLNRRQYKGSTAIYDLSDHVLGLYRVRRGTFSEIEDESYDGDFCFRFGTCDKTRFEPFEIFVEFDKNSKRFKLADDPDDETLQSIAGLMAGSEPLNQSQICKLARKELGIKSVGKITSLLKKGVGKYWRILPTGFKNSSHYISIS